jgi:hypothetical protein
MKHCLMLFPECSPYSVLYQLVPAQVQHWIEASKEECEFLPFIDDLAPAKDSPLTPG